MFGLAVIAETPPYGGCTMQISFVSARLHMLHHGLISLHMQICEAARMPGEPRSFCNTWINHLVLNLPTLAVAIDDSLMALVERCVKHLAAEGAASPVRAQPQSPAMTADQVGNVRK